jgi:UDP-N-acetylglucosamine--N-acetylmuramyl-(pentapeptide) pyrophosphoryl-undecaprenol N-acetylglucosamine transferase
LNVLFAGGGTGGHLYPAVAMAGELLKLVPGASVSFAGTKNGIEATEIPRMGYRLHLLPVRGLKRGGSFRAIISNVGVLADFAGALVSASSIIGREKPDVVVGTGGFASAPMLLAAQLMGRRTLIQEQNAFPGVTTKLLSLLAGEIHLSFSEAKGYIRRKKGVFVTGNPARSFQPVGSEEARMRFGLQEPLPTLLVFGGSRGARSINNAALQWLEEFSSGTNLIWQTGALDYDRISSQVKPSGRLWIGPYIENMGDAYAVSDLVVCRAGASTIAELTNMGKPSVLVPYPYATGDHQRFNAKALVRSGAAMLIDDSRLETPGAKQIVFDLLHDSGRLDAMSVSCHALAHPDAARLLAERIIQLANI